MRRSLRIMVLFFTICLAFSFFPVVTGTAYASFEGGQLSSTTPYYARIKYSDAEIERIVSSLYRKPREKEYLNEYFRGKIDFNGRAVYAYNSPDAGSTKLFNVEDGEEVTVVAYYKNRERYCVIVNSKNRACWINAAYISLILEDDYSEPSPRAHESDTSNVGYSNAEINQIVSSLYRKPKDSEYLDEYYRGRIDHDGYSVYAYNSPDANAYKILDVEDGEEVTVIAYYRTNDRYCVIVNSKNRACWINAAYISLILSRNG